MHELSHLLGATEDEARDFQKYAAWMLSSNVAQISAKDFTVRAQIAARDLYRAASKLKDQVKTLTGKELSKAMAAIYVPQHEFFAATKSNPFSIFNGPENEYFVYIDAQFQVAKWYFEIASLDSSSSAADLDRAKHLQAQLDEVFQGTDEVSYPDYYLRRFGWTKHPAQPANAKIYKIQTIPELQKFLEKYTEDISVINQAVRNLSFDSQMGPMPVFETESNPWLKFVGRFDVIDRVCTKPGMGLETTAIEIAPNAQDLDRLRLKMFWEYGQGDEGGLYNGATLPNGKTAIYVDGDASSAKRVEETGDRWGISFDQSTTEIKQVAGEYVLTETYFFHRNYSTPAKDETQSCTMKLKRTGN